MLNNDILYCITLRRQASTMYTCGCKLPNALTTLQMLLVFFRAQQAIKLLGFG